MTLMLDSAGRIALPLPLLEKLGLGPGAEVDVQDTSDGLVVKRALPHSGLVKKMGRWVHTAKLPLGFDATQCVRDDRDERMDRLAAL